jgi:phenylacetate-CoA ligase
MIYERDKECMARDTLASLQLEALQAVLARVYLHVPFYRKRFDQERIDIDEVRSLDALAGLPFTTREDLQANYPYGLFAVPLREVVRIHASTCMSVVVGYTRNDIKTWADLAARVLVAGGVGKDDVVQIALGYNLSTGGFGLHYGAEHIGASVIPTSTGNTRRQLKIMRDFKTTALVATPSYASLLGRTLHEQGIPRGSLSLRVALLGGEPMPEALRARISDYLGVVVVDNYGLSEVMGPGVASECRERNGLHINEDHFLVEIVDPTTLRPVPEGELGELVITTLSKEAFPVVRFRTRDLTRLLPGTCPCGRTHRRMARIERRSDEILIVRGIKVDPRRVGDLFAEIEGHVPAHQLLVEREAEMDSLTLLVGVEESSGFDEVRKQQERLDKLRRGFSSELGLNVAVRLVEQQSLDGGKRVVDRRVG